MQAGKVSSEIATDVAHALSLAEAARAIVCEDNVCGKVAAAKATAKRWFARGLPPVRHGRAICMPERPGRPERPELLAPRHMPKRSRGGAKGRFALIHSLAHIELSAVDMTWDLVARFGSQPMPRTFFDDWVQVGLEEAKHFELLHRRLGELGGAYGDLPAHDGLWQAAQDTGHDLLARLAIVPLVLEARGLDVGPEMIAGLQKAGDQASADILKIIYRDEKKHVAAGMRWFRYICQRDGRPLEATYHRLVRQHFRAPIKPPFNQEARSEAGLTPGFYKPLTAFGAPP
ncbi:MAG: ferritin-like domain-containing protein [Pseudomonadota bacterium]